MLGNATEEQAKFEDSKVQLDNDVNIAEEAFVAEQVELLKQQKDQASRSSESEGRAPIGMGGYRNFAVDENANVDDMIDFITRKTVPVKREDLRHNSR